MRAAILLMLLALVGCSSVPKKTYVEPEDELVQACIRQCNVGKTQCRANGQEAYKRCRNNYEWREREFQFCRAQGGGFCMKPERCKPADVSHCTQGYDACFSDCGGRIEIEDPEG